MIIVIMRSLISSHYANYARKRSSVVHLPPNSTEIQEFCVQQNKNYVML